MGIDLLDQIVRRLDAMDRERDLARDEGKLRHAEVLRKIGEASDRINVQNGRVGKLEEKTNGMDTVQKQAISTLERVADRVERIDEDNQQFREDVRGWREFKIGMDAIAKTRSWRWPAFVGLVSAVVGGAALLVFKIAIESL